MTADQSICIIIRRAGSSQLYELPRGSLGERANLETPFGYNPGRGNIVLHDPSLEDIHGHIKHDGEAHRDERPVHGARTPYRLRAKADGIRLDGIPIPPDVEIQLRIGQEISVGEKYVLFVDCCFPISETKPLSNLPPVYDSQTRNVPPMSASLDTYLSASHLLLPLLPECYRSIYTLGQREDFLTRFLALFESVLLPIQWTATNYALFLHPESAPPSMLPALASWFGEQLPHETELRRSFLKVLPGAIKRRGSSEALRRLLVAYTGRAVEIEIEDETWTINIEGKNWDTEGVKHLVARYKPFFVEFKLTPDLE